LLLTGNEALHFYNGGGTIGVLIGLPLKKLLSFSFNTTVNSPEQWISG
jgi:hypothetical protein